MNEGESVSPADASLHLDEIERLLATRSRVPVRVYASSVQEKDAFAYVLVRRRGKKELAVIGEEAPAFEVGCVLEQGDTKVYLCPCSPANARRLRATFPWTAPRPLGRVSAIGCGDRLGLATPGHIQACRATDVVPVLAQQSIREMQRTGRTPQEVLDDVSWAVFQEGYTAGFGADADHLKTEEHIDICFAVGYTMYTIDPSDYVDNRADRMAGEELAERFTALPWERLDTTPEECLGRYTGSSIEVTGSSGDVRIEFDAEALQRAAVKYGAAIAHTKKLARYLAAQYESARPGASYDLEMSVDETASPTRPREHYFVAAELRRLGVEVTGLAPRFVGAFEKGIDFIGDPEAFERSFEKHAVIAKAFGGYKLSIHSGSDKFSVFPIIGRHAGDHVHLKTAGTSFLEALRIPARHDPELFRRIVDVAFDRFEEDRKTYHVSTDLSAIPNPTEVPDNELETAYLGENNGRQLLHLTYGSILSATRSGEARFKDRLFDVLDEHEEEHYEALKTHFLRHVESVGPMTRRGEVEIDGPSSMRQ